MIGYIPVNNGHRSSVKDIKVISKSSRGNKKFKKKLKLWSLRESEEKEKFAEGVNDKCDGNKDGRALERKLLDVASEACGYTKAKPNHFETW